jgi:GLPGLI family protein
MKKYIKLLFLLPVIGYMAITPANAQKAKSFKGTITYDLTYSGDGIDAAKLAQMPKESVLKIYENKTLQESGPSSIITNGDLKIKYLLFDFSAYGAKKYLIKQTEEDIKKEEAENGGSEIKYIDETKEIAGYKCKKAEITAKNPDDDEEKAAKITVWYTEELGGEAVNFGNDMFHGLKGIALEYEVITPKVTVKAVTKTVVKGKVKETEFLIPTDFQETTMEAFQEEMKALMGGGDE